MGTGRGSMLAFVGGVGTVHLLAGPTPWEVVLGVAVALWLAAVAVFLAARLGCDRSVASHVARGLPLAARPERGDRGKSSAKRSGYTAALLTTAFLAGLAYGSWRVELRLSDALHPDNEDKVTRVVLRVAELPRLDADSRVFVADVVSSIPEGVPSRVQVRWNAPHYSGPYGSRNDKRRYEFPDLAPGQLWRMALVLRTPHGSRNPHAFDYEGHVFAQGIRATGTVRGRPELLGDDPWASVPVAAQRARHRVRGAMLPHIGELRWGAVLLALAIGDQASVASNDWLTFNRSGLTHLVSISGSHVTMIAVLAAMAVSFLWRRLTFRGRALAERLPAQLAAAFVALLVAWLYCLLAGWGVPARRTFVMLAVVALSLAWRVPLNPTHVLAVAAVAVVVLDPWSLLASGFWLSFLAVYVLMASTGWWGQGVERGAPVRFGKWFDGVATATRLQLLVTLALMPPLALLFNEVSLVSPLANAYAIPVMGALVTPLALLLAGVALIPALDPVTGVVAWVAHWLLELCMWPTEWLAALPGASIAVAAVPWWMFLSAMLGVGIALTPRGIPGRSMGWAFMLPALVWTPARPAPGDWELHALDVGQGSALVLRTAGHVLVYDTGVRYSPEADAAQRTLLPFLRAKGIRGIDVLVVSHADLDHVGGLRSVLETVPVGQGYASFDLPAWIRRESRLLGRRDSPPMPVALTPCVYGALWRVDDVSFEFLWPLGERSIDLTADTRERNRNACVLRVRGRHHSVILPGDIGADEEKALVERGLGVADVVVAAHHGSRHSSAVPFVKAVQAEHVIAQAGRWNRYGHPAEVIRRRWQAEGAEFWDTGRHGAILVESRNGVLAVSAERQRDPRYWGVRPDGCASRCDAR